MRLIVRKSSAFFGDYEAITRWYLRRADANVAKRWLDALDDTIQQIAATPELGRVRNFLHPELKDIRSVSVRRPFHRHLVFYRINGSELVVERIIHGSRDLPNRLLHS